MGDPSGEHLAALESRLPSTWTMRRRSRSDFTLSIELSEVGCDHPDVYAVRAKNRH